MEDRVIAVAAGKQIRESEFHQFVSNMPPQQQQIVATPEGRRQALTQYANYFLFAKYGEEKEYDKTEEFKSILAGARTELLSQYALTQELQGISASEEECRAYFEANKDRFRKGAQANAKHILMDSEEKIREVAEEIQSGQKTFEEAAKEYSTCPSASQGGSLGSFGRGQMVPEFDAAVFGAEETGKLIGPVKTQFGYHLIVVDSLNPGEETAFDDCSSQIRQQLTNQKQNEKYMAVREEIIEKYGLEFKE